MKKGPAFLSVAEISSYNVDAISYMFLNICSLKLEYAHYRCIAHLKKGSILTCFIVFSCRSTLNDVKTRSGWALSTNLTRSLQSYSFQVDYLRTSKLETLEGSIGRVQVSIIYCKAPQTTSGLERCLNLNYQSSSSSSSPSS